MTSRDWLILIASVSLLVQATFSVLGIVAAFRMNRAANRPTVRDRRLIEEYAHGDLLKAAGACLHRPAYAAPGCDCRQGRPW
jgi:hypothetical protein